MGWARGNRPWPGVMLLQHLWSGTCWPCHTRRTGVQRFGFHGRLSLVGEPDEGRWPGLFLQRVFIPVYLGCPQQAGGIQSCCLWAAHPLWPWPSKPWLWLQELSFMPLASTLWSYFCLTIPRVWGVGTVRLALKNCVLCSKKIDVIVGIFYR